MTERRTMTSENFVPRYGYRFYHWIVIEPVLNHPGSEPLYWCQCDCGLRRKISILLFSNKDVKSCGCLGSLYTAFELLEMSGPTTRSGEYRSFQGANQRCHNPNNGRFSKYGSLDGLVEERWKRSTKNAFENFVNDLGRKPSPIHSLERKNNEKGYSRENCKWATPDEQMRNISTNVLVKFEGKWVTRSEIGERAGLSVAGVQHRLNKGLTGTDLLTPPKERHVVFHDGQNWSIPDLANRYGIEKGGLYHRLLNLKMSAEDAIADYFKYKANRSGISHLDLFEINGEKISLLDASEKYGIDVGTLRARIKSGYTDSDIVRPLEKSRVPTYLYQGKHHTAVSLSKLTGISPSTLHRRLFRKNMSVEEAINTPVRIKPKK